VEEESRQGWTPSPGYPGRRTIQLESPRTPGVCQALTFVNQQVHDGCIQVRKIDVYGRPLAGWNVTVTRKDGTWPGVTRATGNTGEVIFDGLALGEWIVKEEIQDWWRAVGPAEQTVDLQQPGSPCTPVAFKNEPLGCIDGYKINHLDQGLPGWTITIHNQATGESFSAVTDSSGYFQFRGLTLGTWQVSEVLQTGWEAITPGEFDVVVDAPFTCQHIRFKNKTNFACVDVFKRDAYDGAGLPGWEITVRPAYGGEAATAVTDGTGHVRFNGLTPGNYVISEKMQSGWTPVTPQSLAVPLEATGSCRIVTFENRQTTSPPALPTTGGTLPGGGCRATYTVHAGNTLFSIARRYNTTVAAIKQANGLISDLISVGQTLCIP
jgi:LysM repeat protein